MEKKYFIGYDKNTNSNTFAYTLLNSIQCYLKQHGTEYTFSLDDDIKEAIFTSATAFSLYAPAMKKRKIVSKVLTCCDKEDITLDKKGNLVLNANSINSYRQADVLYYVFDSHLELLKKAGLEAKAQKRLTVPNILETDVIPDSEKKAFLRYFKIQKDTKLFVAYGTCGPKQLDTIFSIARNNPEHQFIYFGEGNPDLLKQAALDVTFMAENIQFFSHCPECLYRSMLSSINALIIIDDIVTYPQLVLDVIRFRVPVISYHASHNLPELINKDTAYLAENIGELIDIFDQLDNPEKTEKACLAVKQYTC